MKTGVTYLGHHNPRHLRTDMAAMQALELDDVLLAAQENDFVHFTGKLYFTPAIAKDFGLRPLVIFWGALNLFGGGRSSHFLLEHPECFQVGIDGSHRSGGCYVNSISVGYIQQLIDISVDLGFAGYFVDEPTPLLNCYCPSCRAKFAEYYGTDLVVAPYEIREEFRRRCVVEYVQTICNYCKNTHPSLETICCAMPTDRSVWEAVGALPTLDNIGTDIYWANNQRPVEEMIPLVNDLAAIAARNRKVHHQWLQCWQVRAGNERRILELGKTLVQAQPDSLYVWAWEGQIGTAETCDDPALAWSAACEVLKLAKTQP